MYGLGITYNIARTPTTLRDFQTYVATYPRTTAPAPTPVRTTTTSIPKTTTTTATATNPKATTATVTPPKTYIPKPPSVSSVATSRPVASDGTPLTIPSDVSGNLLSAEKSPLWLILAGLGALLLLENRKKGRR